MRMTTEKKRAVIYVYLLVSGSVLCAKEREPQKPLERKISFSHQSSGIKINENSQLIVSKPIANWDGTLAVPDAASASSPATITGEKISFEGGILIGGGSQALFTGLYDPSGNGGLDTILLQGSPYKPQRFRAEPGVVLKRVCVSGTNNILEGQPSFTTPTNMTAAIKLEDSQTQLVLDLHSKLTVSIDLQGGLLCLADSLEFSDHAQIYPQGRVSLNGHTLSFGGHDLSLGHTIVWQDGGKISLCGKTHLTGEWVFDGDTHINGNGNLLDLRSGGTIRIRPDTKLYLTDLKLGGLGRPDLVNPGIGNGWIVFDHDETSSLILQQVEIELDGTYTITNGHVVVCGPTTVGTKEHFLAFRVPAGATTTKRLTIDGTTLWKDNLDVPEIFAGGIDVGAGEPAPLLDKVNSGTIKCASSTGSTTVVIGGGGDVEEVHVYPEVCIATVGSTFPGAIFGTTTIGDGIVGGPTNFTWDGRGRTIVFADWEGGPQFKVLAGHTITLSDIDFSRIHDHTFSFGDDDSQIIIGNDVTFEIDEDTTISQPNGLVVNAPDAPFEIAGMHGCKMFSLSADYNGAPVLDLNEHTLVLENIMFDGLEHIDADPGALIDIRCNTVARAGDTVNENIDFNVVGPHSQLIASNASGTINADNAEVSDFSINPDAGTYPYRPLDLTLANNSTLNLADSPTTLGPDDTITVQGVGNVINVTNTFTLEGSVALEPGAELTFAFAQECGAQGRLIIDTDIDVPEDARLTFRGNGEVEVFHTHRFNLGGTSDANRGVLSVVEFARFLLQDRPQGVVETEAFIDGIGIICVDRGGEIRIGDVRHLIIGSAPEDDIVVMVDRNGAIHAQGRGSIISLQQGRFDLDFEQGGMLSITDRAIFEVNSLKNTAAAGFVERWVFDTNGILNIDTDGILRLSANRDNLPTFWENEGGDVRGDGLVEWQGTRFAGRIQHRLFQDRRIQPFALVSAFVQRQTNLANSTVFIDSQGRDVLRLQNGRLVYLRAKDVISRENSAGGVIGFNSVDGRTFTINLDGSRS